MGIRRFDNEYRLKLLVSPWAILPGCLIRDKYAMAREVGDKSHLPSGQVPMEISSLVAPVRIGGSSLGISPDRQFPPPLKLLGVPGVISFQVSIWGPM